jgi:hypothetical protein
MAVIANLPRTLGRGTYKLSCTTTSITGTGNVTTGLSTVSYAVATVINSGTSLPTNSAAITSISSGTVSVVVTNHASAANSVESSAKNVTVIAIGY